MTDGNKHSVLFQVPADGGAFVSGFMPDSGKPDVVATYEGKQGGKYCYKVGNKTIMTTVWHGVAANRTGGKPTAATQILLALGMLAPRSESRSSDGEVTSTISADAFLKLTKKQQGEMLQRGVRIQ